MTDLRRLSPKATTSNSRQAKAHPVSKEKQSPKSMAKWINKIADEGSPTYVIGARHTLEKFLLNNRIRRFVPARAQSKWKLMTDQTGVDEDWFGFRRTDAKAIGDLPPDHIGIVTKKHNIEISFLGNTDWSLLRLPNRPSSCLTVMVCALWKSQRKSNSHGTKKP